MSGYGSLPALEFAEPRDVAVWLANFRIAPGGVTPQKAMQPPPSIVHRADTQGE